MTDEQLEAIWDSLWGYHGREPMKVSHLEFSRAIEAAAISPLLERIAELERKSDQDDETIQWQAAKLAQRVPDGLKLVPTEPTERMILAFAEQNGHPDNSLSDDIRAFYAAMIAAAPEQQDHSERCQNCDDTGYVHSTDGEWRGTCHRPAGQAPNAQQATKQALTDPENQPNQYGFECFMKGQKMAFRIGNQTFTLDYEPDETKEFDFMRDMLAKAFSTFTPGVKTAQQAEAQEPACRVWQQQIGPGHGTPAFTRYEIKWLGVNPLVWSGDLFTRPQPAQLQALSCSEVLNLPVMPLMTITEIAEAISTALAAKNGVVLTVTKAKESK